MIFSNIRCGQLFILCLALSLWSCERVQESSPPNIVLIFMDDMGYGDLECYGHPSIRTPHLNQMAENGIRFTSFYAPASICTPSRAGILTGRYPVRNAPYNFGPESKNGLPLSEITIADVLKDVGYRTAAIGKWHLGHQTPYLPTSRGFDSFYGLPYSNDMILPWCPWLSDEDKLHLYQDTSIIKEIGKAQDDLTLDYTAQALDFIQTESDQPFFLYLAHSMPHLPISTSEKFAGTSAAGLYGDVIETVDWSIGEIFATLHQQGIEENTLIIFTSDNGPWHNLPERMTQDGVEHWHTGSTGMLKGAKATTYEGGFRVPGIISWKGQIEQGQVNREIVTALDIFPTLIELCDAQLPTDRTIDGISMLPLLRGEAASPRNTFIYSKLKSIEGIRKGDWKLRYTAEDSLQLYNLMIDPGEMYNRAAEKPTLVDSLLQEMRAFAQETNAEIMD